MTYASPASLQLALSSTAPRFAWDLREALATRLAAPFVASFSRLHPTGFITGPDGKISGLWRVDLSAEWPPELIWTRRRRAELVHFRAYLPEDSTERDIARVVVAMQASDDIAAMFD